MALRIYLARHGQNEDNRDFILNGHRDLPLTDKGREQARELAAGIKELGLSFHKTAASPLVRAYETGEIVCRELGLPAPPKEPDLIERHFGVMTGKPIAEIEKLVPQEHILKGEMVTYFLEAEGAEDYPSTIARARRLLARTRQRYLKRQEDISLLWFTHSDIGKILYSTYYGIPWKEVLAGFHFGNCELLVLEQGTARREHVVRIPQFNH